jgi:hypothetical protein
LLNGSGGLFGFWLVDLVQRDGVAECFELALQAPGAVLDRVALALPVGPEIAVRDFVADDVEVRDEQVVPDSADRFLFASPTAELGVVSGEVGLFGADRGLAGLLWVNAKRAFAILRKVAQNGVQSSSG